MSFFKTIQFFLLSIQEILITQTLKKTLNQKNFSRNKSFFQEGCLLSLNSIADSEKNKMEEEMGLILKSCNFEPIEILEYIKKHNTNVYYINSAKPINSVGENEGFFYPQKGFKALYLSLLTTKNFSLKTPELFILSKGTINKYYFLYHFYNWYTFKHGISGIDSETQALLNKYLHNSTDEEINKLQLADIYKLKDAIKQDKAAIEFVFKLCQKYESSQKALEKIKNDGANI
jgi:hypothetical protein